MMHQERALMPVSPAVLRLGGASREVLYIPPVSLCQEHHVSLFLSKGGFTVSVGATARQWVRRAAICQCLACQRGSAEGCTRFLGGGREIASCRRERREKSWFAVRPDGWEERGDLGEESSVDGDVEEASGLGWKSAVQSGRLKWALFHFRCYQSVVFPYSASFLSFPPFSRISSPPSACPSLLVFDR